MMHTKDFLHDLVANVQSLGFFDTIKLICEDDGVKIQTYTQGSCVLMGKTNDPVNGFGGTFGIHNLNKLKSILTLEPYRENATIIVEQNDGTPTNLHFENETRTFQNDIRFSTTNEIEAVIKSSGFDNFSEPDYQIMTEPTLDNVKLFGFQASITDEEMFTLKKDGTKLILKFGSPSTNAGEFVFSDDVKSDFPEHLSWNINTTLPIMRLNGKVKMQFSNREWLKITVNTGLSVYAYFLSAKT